MWDAFDPAVMLSTELAERREDGYDVTDVEDESGQLSRTARSMSSSVRTQASSTWRSDRTG